MQQTTAWQDDSSLELTWHAARRAQQRSASVEEVDLVLGYGRRWRQPGARSICFVGKRDVRQMAKHGVDLRSCEGLAVAVNDLGVVVTILRSDDLSRLRRFGVGTNPWRGNRA